MPRLDLHVHSSLSPDSIASPDKIFRRCARAGIDGVAITDHNAVSAALRLRAQAPAGFTVIIGEEVDTAEGELLAYFLSEPVAPGKSLEETVAAIRAQGGVISVPHPFGSFRRGRPSAQALERLLPEIDMVETFNARNLFDSDDAKALAAAKRHGKACAAGSDAHTLWEIGRAYVEIPAFNGPAEFLAAMRSAAAHARRTPVIAHGVTACVKIAGRLRGLVE
ncbi:MAG: PHP-associated domain-containing protein [Elusimicrobiales bacterium]|nr:PHP-associated domain-containing protein [Elusimicrobiales bacterium]